VSVVSGALAAGVTVAAGLALAAGVAQPFTAASAQQNPNAPQNFTKITAPVIALTHARVIDGTGAPARADPTWCCATRDRRSRERDCDRGSRRATIVDLTGRTVIPGPHSRHRLQARRRLRPPRS
jgi:hypothetical protein